MDAADCRASALFGGGENHCYVLWNTASDHVTYNMSAGISAEKGIQAGESVSITPGAKLVKMIIKGECATADGRQSDPYCVECFHKDDPNNEKMLASVLAHTKGHAYVINMKYSLVVPHYGDMN